MAETTGISWSHATLNFWVGCTKVSTGDRGACELCYAETWAKRWPAYRDTWGVRAQRVRFKETRAKALKLERLAIASGKPFFCFSNSLSDIFDNEVPIAWLAEAFADMAAAPHVTFLLLTKRAPNILKRVKAAGGLPPNAAFGITVVTQDEVDRDVPHLLAAKAVLEPAFAFLSMEPLMGPVDLCCIPAKGWWSAAGLGAEWGGAASSLRLDGRGLDWVITGGESGAKARPTHPDWLRSIRDQCAAAGVPYHHKQNGEWVGEDQFPGASWLTCEELVWPDTGSSWRVGKKASGRLLDGVLHDAMPEVRT